MKVIWFLSVTLKSVSAKQLPEMPLALFFFQSATPTPAPSPEKLPAWLTLVFVIGVAFIGLLLLIALVRSWFTRSGGAAHVLANLSTDIRKRLGATATNRGLRVWRWLFVLIAIGMFGFHVYWARYAPQRNQ